MKALFVDGPAAGELREYPYDTTSIAMRVTKPLNPVNIVLHDGQLPPDGRRHSFDLIQYVKFATDHVGRSLFRVNK